MKNKILYSLLTLTVFGVLASCQGEKDLIIIDGNLPIKTSTLYMVGDATPNGWSIDDPTPLEATEDDPLIFAWEGTLYKGEMKLCLITGSWDNPFIRPLYDGLEIGKDPIVEQSFQMHAGDPDEKWHIIESGKYRLTFNMRDWTMSTEFTGEMDAPAKEPIITEVAYIVGDATPKGWNIDSPTQLTKTADFTFEYEGKLTQGELKACIETGSWDAAFIRPETDGVQISKNGIESNDFIFVANPDNKWHVMDEGIYHLTFDLKNLTITTEYIGGGTASDKSPIESSTLYMIGDATPGGWSMDDATAYKVSASNKYLFVWEGELVQGNMKACLKPDPTFSCPFIRPKTANCKISSKGVDSPDFVYTTSPDDQWQVTEAGTYKITFDLKNWTISVEKQSGNNGNTGGNNDKSPLETSTLYMIGDATPNGWSMDNPTQFTASSTDTYIFTWTGTLNKGDMKACLQPDGTFSCPFVRPSSDGCEINKNGVAASDFIYTTGPDYKWKVTEAGKYTLTFNLNNWTFEAKYLD